MKNSKMLYKLIINTVDFPSDAIKWHNHCKVAEVVTNKIKSKESKLNFNLFEKITKNKMGRRSTHNIEK